jgi:hypothetical protein
MKIWLLFFWCIVTLNATVLHEKIENLIGQKDYKLHKNLITLIFNDQAKFFLANERLNYPLVLKELKQNGLLHLKLPQPQEIEVEFHTNKDSVKSLKILNDTLKALGYYYYFTKSTQYNSNGLLVWTIKLKTEFVIDPLVFVNEILKNDCRVVEINKEENHKWIYKIDTNFANIAESIFIDSNELIKLQKPLRPYFIKINGSGVLKVMSTSLNHWYPYIVFYDEHLNILNIIKKEQFSRRVSLSIPLQTKYIKITDLYTLDNIKRGLNVMIKE